MEINYLILMDLVEVDLDSMLQWAFGNLFL
jgi:hypothetical protein